MAIDVGSFIPSQVIFHKVPKDKKGEKDFGALEEELAEAPINLSPKLKTYFKDRIVESLKKRFDVVYSPPPPPPPAADDDEGAKVPDPADAISPVPGLVLEFFEGNGENFVEASRTMARHLYDRQDGVPNEGILVLVEGTLMSGTPSGKCLVLLKLEPSEAVTIDPTTTKDGKATYAVEVHDVAFEKRARVFKVALFPRTDSLANLTAVVSDPQQGRAGLHEEDVALFFRKYIGCDFKETADRQTKAFVEYLDDFAPKIADEEKRRDFIIAGLEELNNNEGVINPQDFAARTLTPELQDEFLRPLRNEDQSIGLIPKDRTALPRRLDNVMFEFQGGLKIFGPRTEVEDHVKKNKQGNWEVDAPVKWIGPKAR
jgi:hypothetical protein